MFSRPKAHRFPVSLLPADSPVAIRQGASSDSSSVTPDVGIHDQLVTFTRYEVQNVLDAAQIDVLQLYSSAPHLRDVLRDNLLDGFDDCNLREAKHMQILHEQLRGEHRILDAYNKHRLGRAAHLRYKNMQKPADPVEYDVADNIPELLRQFPVRHQLSLHDCHVQVPPIYQAPDNVAGHKGPPKPVATPSNRPIKTPVSVASSSKVSTKSGNNTTPSQITPSKKSMGRGAPNYDKLADAPSAYLGLPDGNLTLAEITAFVPQSLKSWDVIDRLLWNGTMSVTLAAMINHFRVMPRGRIENNSVYRLMKGPMDKRALIDATYEQWSVSRHQQIEPPEDFDPASVSVAGFRTPLHFNRGGIQMDTQTASEAILFRDLAKGVKFIPSGDDALDLTRCVQYCVDHPDEDWYYPKDFSTLVSQLPQSPEFEGYPDGPAPVLPGHQDSAIVKRYTSVNKINGAKHTFNRGRDAHGRLLKSANRCSDDGDDGSDDDSDGNTNSGGRTARMKKRKRPAAGGRGKENLAPATPRSGRKKNRAFEGSTLPMYPSGLHIELHESDIASDSDSDAYKAPKKKTKVVGSVRSSGRTKRFSGSYSIEAIALGDYNDEEEAEKSAPKNKRVLNTAAARMMGRAPGFIYAELSDDDDAEDGGILGDVEE